MAPFNLTSLEEPTDEQLQYIMEGVAETGRKSMSNAEAAYEKMLQDTIARVQERFSADERRDRIHSGYAEQGKRSVENQLQSA